MRLQRCVRRDWISRSCRTSNRASRSWEFAWDYRCFLMSVWKTASTKGWAFCRGKEPEDGSENPGEFRGDELILRQRNPLTIDRTFIPGRDMIESLEPRRLYHSATVADGVLTFLGEPTNDVLTVSVLGNNYHVTA